MMEFRIKKADPKVCAVILKAIVEHQAYRFTGKVVFPTIEECPSEKTVIEISPSDVTEISSADQIKQGVIDVVSKYGENEFHFGNVEVVIAEPATV